jgi:hypothetical protein
LLLAAVLPAEAGLPIPWIPSNAGVLWYQTNDPSYPLTPPRQPPGDAQGAWWMTRRLAAHPTLPGVMHLGSFFHGLYTSTGTGGWVTLTPGCWLPIDPPAPVPPGTAETYRFARRAAIQATGLHGCAIEGIAYDQVIPNRMYVAVYDVASLTGTEPILADAGVYVSDDLGISWRRLIGGLRGNGLSVARTGLSTTIVAGFIQASNAAVGATPGNGSLVVSRDDGATWSTATLPASGCADTPGTSQRITPSVLIDPRDPSTIFAGTNAGLYTSRDAGRTWSATRIACGGVWGLALSPDSGTLFIGDKDGVISRAPTSTLAFTPIVDLGVGKVQSLVQDARDPTTLYAAIWSGSDIGVFRVSTIGGGKARLDDSLLRDVVPLDQGWPGGVPKPFPISFRDGAGASAPSLFLAQRGPLPNPAPAPLWVSTIFRGTFFRGD